MAPQKNKRKKFALAVPKQKRPGFDTFEVKRKRSNNKGEKVQVAEAVEPETGIHSQAWALQTKRQSGPLLNTIPLEVRTRIFTLLLRSYGTSVVLHKSGEKFRSATGIRKRKQDNIIKSFVVLSSTCRQMYIEVIGRALLYRVGSFVFSSPTLMYNYLSCINPFHASNISTLSLEVHLTRHALAVPQKVIQTLASLQPSLKYLTIKLYVDTYLLSESSVLSQPTSCELHVTARTKLESSKRWEALGALKTFEISFQGHKHFNFWPYSVAIDGDSAGRKTLRDNIKAVVIRS